MKSKPALHSILLSRKLQVDNPALRNVFGALLCMFQARLVAALGDHQAAGILRAGVGPQDVAMLPTSLVQGVAICRTPGARSFPLVQQGLRLFYFRLRC